VLIHHNSLQLRLEAWAWWEGGWMCWMRADRFVQARLPGQCSRRQPEGGEEADESVKCVAEGQEFMASSWSSSATVLRSTKSWYAGIDIRVLVEVT